MYGCCYLLGVSVKVTAGLILVACCPAGSISNTYCYLMKGNTSLSVNLTALSSLAAMVATPVVLTAAHGVLGSKSSGLPLIPVLSMVQELSLMMVVPLVIGVFIHAKIPTWVSLHRRVLRKVAFTLVVALLVLVIGSEPKAVIGHLQEIALVTVLFTIVLSVSGWLISLAFRLSANDRWAVLFEFPCRNLAIAAVTGITVLNRPELVRFAAALLLTQTVMFLMLISAIIKHREIKRMLIS